MAGLGAPELIIILLVILVLFGGAKLPKLARSLGQAQKEFKQGLSDSHAEEQAAAVAPPQAPVVTQLPPQAPVGTQLPPQPPVATPLPPQTPIASPPPPQGPVSS